MQEPKAIKEKTIERVKQTGELATWLKENKKEDISGQYVL